MNASPAKAKTDPGLPPVVTTYPFLYFDQVLSQTPDSLELLKNVSADEWSSLPGAPLPGWVLLEVMAQAAGRLGQILEPGVAFHYLVLSQIKRARFHRAALAGDQLLLKVQLVALFKRSLTLRVAARTEAGRIANAEFYFIKF
jgi:3-hydroxymyristoyl/3-hydroxydecanoyl-(acyl carrier protein) dehydratase